ncbi:MAG: hypothetical protein H6713_20615 [Myxococcales bacterium]|nr:hypothetical protein [Myxococcales bacterium]
MSGASVTARWIAAIARSSRPRLEPTPSTGRTWVDGRRRELGRAREQRDRVAVARGAERLEPAGEQPVVLGGGALEVGAAVLHSETRPPRVGAAAWAGVGSHRARSDASTAQAGREVKRSRVPAARVTDSARLRPSGRRGAQAFAFRRRSSAGAEPRELARARARRAGASGRAAVVEAALQGVGEDPRARREDFPQYTVMRPMAWSPGVFNPGTCEFDNQKAWTTGAVTGQPGSVHAIMLNGDTGQVEAEINVPELQTIGAGPYGGAVDAEGNFWFHSRDAAPYPLVRVDGQDFTYQLWNVPAPVNPYGITIDTNGRIWLAGYIGGIGRFDPQTETWDVVEGLTGLGIQEDANGRMWIAIYPWGGTVGAWGLDVETMEQVGLIDLTSYTAQSRGLSVDFEGNIWVVEQGARAFRVNPNDQTTEIYDGLDGAYTYSDMTGWGLKNIIPG